MAKITKDSTLKQALNVPGAEKILEHFNTPCIHCPMAAMEMNKLKLGEIAAMYGLDLDGLLRELNQKAGAKK
ncbi:MAG: disulfide oxidoreductase [Candidatus Aenigmarchaeota archaeon]|nr:disulfide oxidoreductase [Candidatus Aenigmarchaeota archaeon]